MFENHCCSPSFCFKEDLLIVFHIEISWSLLERYTTSENFFCFPRSILSLPIPWVKYSLITLFNTIELCPSPLQNLPQVPNSQNKQQPFILRLGLLYQKLYPPPQEISSHNFSSQTLTILHSSIFSDVRSQHTSFKNSMLHFSSHCNIFSLFFYSTSRIMASSHELYCILIDNMLPTH